MRLTGFRSGANLGIARLEESALTDPSMVGASGREHATGAEGCQMPSLKRYRNIVYDSARWDGFRFREGAMSSSTRRPSAERPGRRRCA